MKTFLTTLPIAHRGLHDETRPENGISAFRAAIEHGFAIEMDVRFTKDRRLVVFHDDSLKRMTGDDRLVIDCTFEELLSLRLEGSDERIPLFQDFLVEIGGRVPLLIEIKSMAGVKPEEIATALAEALKDYAGEYAIQSFQPFYVKAFKKLRPDIPCGLLSSGKFSKRDFDNSPLWRIKASLISNLRLNSTVKPDFISYHFKDYPRRCTNKFKGPKLGWTIRSAADEAYARKYCDNIIFENYLPER